MDFRAGRGAGQMSTHSWRRSIFVIMVLHASCADPSSRRSHPISIPIPVISSLCLILRLSFRPSVCTSVCLSSATKHTNSKDRKIPVHSQSWWCTSSSSKSSSSSLSELSKCSHFQTVSQIFSLPLQIGSFSKEGCVVFKSFANLSLVSPPLTAPLFIHLCTVQSEAPHRYLNTHPSSLPTQPHRYLNLDSKSLLHGDDDHHLFFNCNPHFLSFKLTVPKKQQSLIGGNGSRY